MTEAEAKALPDQIAAEIAALDPPPTYAEAIGVMNGKNGGWGLRQKYIQKLYDAQHSAALADPLFFSLAEAINRHCDDVIRPLVPNVDPEHAEGRGFRPLAVST